MQEKKAMANLKKEEASNRHNEERHRKRKCAPTGNKEKERICARIRQYLKGGVFLYLRVETPKLAADSLFS